MTWPAAWTPVSVRPAACTRTALAAERGHGRSIVRLHRGQGRLGLEAAIGPAVIFDRQAVAGTAESRVPPASGKSAQEVAASCGPSAFALGAQDAHRAGRAGDQQPVVQDRARRAVPIPRRGDSSAFTRIGPRPDGAMNQAPGNGDRPRIWRSTWAAGRSQRMRGLAGF